MEDEVIRHDTNKQQKRYGPQPGTPAGKSTIGAYPEVMSEEVTLELVSKGRSIARYGDGEMNLAMGGSGISQRETSAEMRAELVRILAEPSDCLVGIPNVFSHTPRKSSWLKYATTHIVKYFPQPKYASSFITRPDSAPWIDTPWFWETMRGLWRNKEVTLVYGGPTSKSLQPEWLMTDGALSVRPVEGKRTNAYMGIDEIEEKVGKPNHPVLICLGPTATCLAHRLAKKGVWALDLGHVGMFIKSTGAFKHEVDDLSTPEYREVLKATHEKYKDGKRPWGSSAWRFIPQILKFYAEIDGNTLLDYGCGARTLQLQLKKLDPPKRVMNYDPGLPGMEQMPKPCDLVVCTEVLEHVEPAKLINVLSHINSLALKGVFLTITCSEAGEILTDGRNAHLIVESPGWWLQKLGGWTNWTIKHHEVTDKKKHLLVWLVMNK